MKIEILLLAALLGALPAAALDIKSLVNANGRIEDDVKLPFVNDPAAIGTWRSVDFVDKPELFNPEKRAGDDELFLKELVLLPEGKSPNGWLTWTKGAVMHHGDKTASRYEIRELGGQKYMFFEWKSGDYTIRHKKPQYYVLRKTAEIRRDNIDLPFQDDPAVVGGWTSVDFVESPARFDPAARAWGGDLYLKEMSFLPKGKGGKPWWTWTRGVVMHHGDRTASRYEIKKIKGQTYLFLEWKSGDYVLRGAKPFYYVLKKN
jgi:bla regulator protein BlaR1